MASEERDREKDLAIARKLENALPGLVEKLDTLVSSCTPEEKAALEQIISSAALHTQYVQAHDEGRHDLVYLKPQSAHSTVSMKETFKGLPAKLGLTPDIELSPKEASSIPTPGAFFQPS